MTHRFVLTLALLLLSGCANFGGKNVFFGKRIQEAQPSETVLRVFFDSVGDIYPNKSLNINDAQMSRALTLRQYFSSENSACKTGDLVSACGLAAIAQQDQRKAAWQKVQDEWFEMAAIDIAKATSQGRDLVVLVHGFRVRDADEVYRQARTLMQEAVKHNKPPIFLEVHWDGLTSPTAIGVWGEAQVNGFLAGLSLRRVLAKVDAATKLRVMTHSSGGFVISATLGDPGAVFGNVGLKSDLFAEFRANAAGSSKFPIPKNKDIRVAMVVPATPPASFAGGLDRLELRHPGLLADARLIVGVNEKDIGVSKGPINGALSWFGSTDLGQSLRAFCSLSAQLRSRPKGEMPPAPRLVNFEGSEPVTRAALFWEAHDWELYLQRSKMREMLTALFDEEPQNPEVKNNEADVACSGRS